MKSDDLDKFENWYSREFDKDLHIIKSCRSPKHYLFSTYTLNNYLGKQLESAWKTWNANKNNLIIVDELKKLTNDERKNIFDNFCIYCGSINKPCYCNRDE